MNILAIDPGASGGLAMALDGAPIAAMAMPETEGEICAEIAEWQWDVCYLEKVGGFVAGKAAPGSAMFNFGRNFGFILGVLAALKVRTVLVTPQAWQKALGLGHKDKDTAPAEWKRKLKAEAWRLYPQTTPTLKTADALLILEYARRMERGRNDP